ncbi:universal stress protein [Pontibacter pamirensis]|uniref:universal stress protein n=1 Tax=Pontibacter pamirensis TaxID=2562824 RepID=UPI001389D06B|nr:universal stress protein [Pontibacter pamirensis]
MKTVLVPVDYSQASIKALEVALNLASRVRAQLLLCHVYQSPVYVAEAYHPVYALPAYETKQDAMKKLRTFVKLVRKNSEVDVPIKCTTVTGGVVEELLELARNRKVSLIVMGTTGRGSLENRLFGSTTKHLVKNASCPVLAVPEKARISHLERIVYASALDPAEADALVQLADVRKLFNSSITLLHVNCGREEGKVNIDVRRNELMKNFPDDAYTFSQVICDDIAEGIEHFVEGYNADLVAFTVSKRGFWKNLLQSSITSRLLEEFHLPMLAFPQYAGAVTGIAQEEEQIAKQDQSLKP